MVFEQSSDNKFPFTMLWHLVRKSMKYAVAAGMLYKCASFIREIANEEHTFDSRFGKRTPGRRPAGPNYFVNKDGLQIFWRCWFPKGEPPKGIVVLCHGLAEHSGRYEAFAASLTESGFGVYALDHQGHGASEGDRGHVKRFDDLKQDVLQFTKIVTERHPELLNRFFLVGHSLGGLIAVHAARANPDQWAGVVLSGPALKPDPKVATPFLIAVGNFLSNVLPKMPVDKLPLSGLCGDVAVVRDYVNDPLVYTGGVKARAGTEILCAMQDAMLDAPAFKLPFLILHGDDDGLCAPHGSVEFFDRAGTKQEHKTHITYKGMRHEIFNEKDPAPVRDVVEWLEKRYSRL